MDERIKINGISYAGFHMKIQKMFGKADCCEVCGEKNKKYEWSNKDHKYSIKRNDWKKMCKNCHEKFDAENNIPVSGYKRKPMNLKKICKTCGSIMKINRSQTRKVMCSKCSYELKKIRSSERYWSRKAPNSTRHKYWSGRLREFSNMLNNN